MSGKAPRMKFSAERTPNGHRAWRVLSMVAVLVFLQTALVGPARAGVHVDPNGPAGQEYSDSLNKARGEAGGVGGAAGVPGATQQAPLFGAGVTPQSSGKRAQTGEKGGTTSSLAPSSSGTAGIGDSGSDSKLLLIIPVIAVLLVGTGIALVSRRLDLSEKQ